MTQRKGSGSSSVYRSERQKDQEATGGKTAKTELAVTIAHAAMAAKT